MGICYQLILEEDFDWGYLGKTKDEALKDFENEWGGYIERLASWPHCVVYDIDKGFPYSEERLRLIREHCDKAYTRNDLGLGIEELELPISKPSDVAYFDDINSRRTLEEKRASEEIIRQRLKEKSNG